jgi:cytochrome c biogenesis protein CcmG, thiol:disulfide interchange protein DsbE
MTKNQTESVRAARIGNSPALLIPLLLFAGVVVLLGVGLTRDPREVPSPLIGKPVPKFALPAVKGRSLGLSSNDLKGEVSLVNVFASWCVACRDEHPVLNGADLEGRVAIDWGVYGVPETFVIDRDGRIAYKQIGPVTPEILEQKLRPLIAGLRSGSAAAESRRGRSQ